MTLSSSRKILVKALAMVASVAVVLSIAVAPVQGAGPFNFMPTLRFRLQVEARAVVLLQLAEPDDLPQEIVLRSNVAPHPGMVPSTFRVVKVLKGHDLIAVGDHVEVAISRKPPPPQDPPVWLASYRGADGQERWEMHFEVTEVREAYAEMLLTDMSLSKRLQEYYRFSNSRDFNIDLDAGMELLRTDIKDLFLLQKHLDHDTVVRDAQNPRLGGRRQDVALRLLAVVGTEDDRGWLQERIQSFQNEEEENLSYSLVHRTVSSYLAVAGDDGVEWLIKEQILGNSADCRHRAAVNALCEHARTFYFVSKGKVVEGLQSALNSPGCPYDAVIPMLAYLGDWTVMERVAQLGRDEAAKPPLPEEGEAAVEDCTLIYRRAVGYLRDCPLPEAKDRLEEIRKLDPEAYERELSTIQL